MIDKVKAAERSRTIRAGTPGTGPVIYWMNRDQRADDNWALIYAREQALKLRRPVLVWLGLSGENANERQLLFRIEGLRESADRLARSNLAFMVEAVQPATRLTELISELDAAMLVTDFVPRRFDLEQLRHISERVTTPVEQVDAHNIVPVWIVSDKREYGAYTLRPKLNRLLPKYLTEFPSIKKHPYRMEMPPSRPDWDGLIGRLGLLAVRLPDGVAPGARGAMRQLDAFFSRRLRCYAEERNDPVAGVQSGLSPWLNSGQIAPQRVALEAQKHDGDIASQEAFIEELIVRRELSDNFCFYSPDYDSFATFPDWARRTLTEHQPDPREYLYGREQFEQGETHDQLWNAAEVELVEQGRIPGYLRMYWAKKILEWSPNAEEALATAIRLNDRYALDGWDPNGYAGIAWSIGGVHDRAWFERDVFGKIRYMSYDGCRRKFDVDGYIDQVERITTRELR